jgi:hypothetical protein
MTGPGRHATHEVLNQVPPLAGYDVAQDAALVSALTREGGAWAEPEIAMIRSTPRTRRVRRLSCTIAPRQSRRGRYGGVLGAAPGSAPGVRHQHLTQGLEVLDTLAGAEHHGVERVVRDLHGHHDGDPGWGATTLPLPREGDWRDVLGGRCYESRERIQAAELFAAFPVAVLLSSDK